MLSLLVQIYSTLSSDLKVKFISFILLSVFGGIVEALNILVFPLFVALLVNQNESNYSLDSSFGPIMPSLLGDDTFLLLFIIIVIIGFCLKVLILKKCQDLGSNFSSFLALQSYSKVMLQPYTDFLKISRGSRINLYTKGFTRITNSLILVNKIIASIFTSALIVAALIILSPAVSFGIIIFLAAFYYLIVKVINQKLKHNSRLIVSNNTRYIELLSESFESFKQILLNKTHNINAINLHSFDSTAKILEADNNLFSAIPKITIEFLIILSVIIYFYSTKDSAFVDLAIISTFLFAGLRMLPAFQQIFQGYAYVAASSKEFIQLTDTLRLRPRDETFNKHRDKNKIFNEPPQLLVFQNITVSYPNTDSKILDNASFSIPPATNVAIIGETGSGKSTLLDVICGILPISSGSIHIDGQLMIESTKYKNVELLSDWHYSLSRVPQTIFLKNASVLENFTNLKKDLIISKEAILKSLEMTFLLETFNATNSRLDFKIGHNGEFLSGGQRQRLAISQALSMDLPYLILDEPTSALDPSIQDALMSNLLDFCEKKTLIMVTHNHHLLRHFDIILEVKNSKVLIR